MNHNLQRNTHTHIQHITLYISLRGLLELRPEHQVVLLELVRVLDLLPGPNNNNNNNNTTTTNIIAMTNDNAIMIRIRHTTILLILSNNNNTNINTTNDNTNTNTNTTSTTTTCTGSSAWPGRQSARGLSTSRLAGLPEVNYWYRY